MANKIIKLNVGGRTFMTTLSTLSSKGENFLTRMIENHTSGKIPSLLDENGAFFIDRPGNLFEIILQYLQTGILSTTSPSVMSELDYFGIHSLEKTVFEICQANCEKALIAHPNIDFDFFSKFQQLKTRIKKEVLEFSSQGQTIYQFQIWTQNYGNMPTGLFADSLRNFIVDELNWDRDCYSITRNDEGSANQKRVDLFLIFGKSK